MDEFRDDRNGLALDTDLVKAATREKMDLLRDAAFEVKRCFELSWLVPCVHFGIQWFRRRNV